MIEILYKVIICHLLGDYVLQTDFLANTKGTNWYHLFIHCFLYTLPFVIAFGFNHVGVLLISHIIIDAAKARFNDIDYFTDQVLHYITAVVLYM